MKMVIQEDDSATKYIRDELHTAVVSGHKT